MPTDNFQIVGKIVEVEIIAVRHSIRELKFLESMYGKGAGVNLKALLLYNSKMVECV